MAKVRVYELAKDIGVDAKEVVGVLAAMGADIKGNLSVIDDEHVNKVRSHFEREKAGALGGHRVSAGVSEKENRSDVNDPKEAATHTTPAERPKSAVQPGATTRPVAPRPGQRPVARVAQPGGPPRPVTQVVVPGQRPVAGQPVVARPVPVRPAQGHPPGPGGAGPRPVAPPGVRPVPVAGVRPAQPGQPQQPVAGQAAVRRPIPAQPPAGSPVQAGSPAVVPPPAPPRPAAGQTARPGAGSGAQPGVRPQPAARPTGNAGARPTGRTDGGRPAGRTDGRPAGRTDGRPAGRTDGRPAGRTDGRPAGRTDGRPPAGRTEGPSGKGGARGQRGPTAESVARPGFGGDSAAMRGRTAHRGAEGARGRGHGERDESTVERKAVDMPARKGGRPQGRGRQAAGRHDAPKPAPIPVKRGKIEIPEMITVRDLASKLGIPGALIIKKLMALGVMAVINQAIERDVAVMIVEELGFETAEPKSVEDLLAVEQRKDEPGEAVVRPPVVTIMGHVDHGKTSLLDAIRETKVAASEAGGITQHIGAYQVELQGKKITFLDTPGHEAFTAMRSRGAQATDIAVLVVAADDGAMPQTVEALNHAKVAGVPIIVAVNKMDKPGANPDRVKQQLSDHGLVPEDWGGDTVYVYVSALKREGLDTLLEMILLVAEMRDLKANPGRSAAGVVIEAKLDKGRGPVATVLVQRGTLRVGETVLAGAVVGRIRGMLDDQGKPVETAGPSMPVEILGLSEVPTAGESFLVVSDEKTARIVAGARFDKVRESALSPSARLTLDDLFTRIQQGDVKELNIVLKADVHGSAEALKGSLERLSTEEIRVRVVHSGVGGITESDINLAAASNAILIGFNVRPDVNARKAAERENVDLQLYRVIYEAIDDVKAAMQGLREPTFKEVVLGRAEIRATFKVPGVGVIGGSYVTDGKILRTAQVRVLRDNIVIHEGKIASLKRFKEDAREVASGYECGIGIERFNDLKEGDVIEAFHMEEVKEQA